MKFKYKNLILAMTISSALAATGCTNAAYKTTDTGVRTNVSSTAKPAKTRMASRTNGRVYNRNAGGTVNGTQSNVNRAANGVNSAYHPQAGYDNMPGTRYQGTQMRDAGYNYNRGMGVNSINNNARSQGNYTAGHLTRDNNTTSEYTGVYGGNSRNTAALSQNNVRSNADFTRTGETSNTGNRAAGTDNTRTSITNNARNSAANTIGNTTSRTTRNTAAQKTRNTTASKTKSAAHTVKNTAATHTPAAAAKATTTRTAQAPATHAPAAQAQTVQAPAAQAQPQVIIIKTNDAKSNGFTTSRAPMRTSRVNDSTAVRRNAAGTVNNPVTGGQSKYVRDKLAKYSNELFTAKGIVPSSPSAIKSSAGNAVNAGSRNSINRNATVNNTTARKVATNPRTSVTRSSVNTNTGVDSAISARNADRVSRSNANSIGTRRISNRLADQALNMDNQDLGLDTNARISGIDNVDRTIGQTADQNVNTQALNTADFNQAQTRGIVNNPVNPGSPESMNQLGSQFGVSQMNNQFGVNQIGNQYGVNQYGVTPYGFDQNSPYGNTGMNYRNFRGAENNANFGTYNQFNPANTGAGYQNSYFNQRQGFRNQVMNNNARFSGYRGYGANRGATNTIGDVNNTLDRTGFNRSSDKNTLNNNTGRGTGFTGRDLTNGSHIRNTRGTSISR